MNKRKFWKWAGITLLAMVLMGAAYGQTPAGKQAAEDRIAEEQAAAKAAAERKEKRAEEKAAHDAKVDAEYEKAKVAAAEYEAEQVSAKENAKADESRIKEGLTQLVANSEGVVLSIDKHPGAVDWELVRVTVSDAWYTSPEHEKERFAETVGGAVMDVVSKEHTRVNFYDTYGKELATQKVLGGWKLKR